MNKDFFKEYKKKNEKMIALFNPNTKIGLFKINKLSNCHKHLFYQIYEHNTFDTNHLKVVKTYSCKDKFCQICSKKNSLLVEHNLKEQLEEKAKKQYMRYRSLTLTVKDCSLNELGKTIKLMNIAFNRLMTNFKKNYKVKGFYKKLEITYKIVDGLVMCHPHFHIILSTHISTFNNTNKFLVDDIVKLWSKNLEVDYRANIDIQSLTKNRKTGQVQSLKKSIKEFSKYITKTSDYKNLNTNEMEILDQQIKAVRFYSYGGNLKPKKEKEVQEYLKDYRKIYELYFKWDKNKYVFKQFMNSDILTDDKKFIDLMKKFIIAPIRYLHTDTEKEKKSKKRKYLKEVDVFKTYYDYGDPFADFHNEILIDDDYKQNKLNLEHKMNEIELFEMFENL